MSGAARRLIRVNTALDLSVDPVTLTAQLIDIASPSHHEQAVADALEAALRDIFTRGDGDRAIAEIARFGNTVCARTNRGLKNRVILAGHVDTVPISNNVPHCREGDTIFGCGAVDMKSGLAVYAHLFAQLADAPALAHDLTLIAYEGEEVAVEFNGLGHLQRDHPEWLEGDVALLGEPSGGVIEAGCQGTIRLRVAAAGVRAHSARAWLGSNAAHKLAPVLANIAAYEPREVTIDGCTYREGLNVVDLKAGVATNTIPDEAVMLVNFRFAPDRSLEEALGHARGVIGKHADIEVTVADAAPGALPGLHHPAARALVDAAGGPGAVRAKFGWTDVARFAELGIPAVNFGPGDPGLAHKPEEHVHASEITAVAGALRAFLTSLDVQESA